MSVSSVRHLTQIGRGNTYVAMGGVGVGPVEVAEAVVVVVVVGGGGGIWDTSVKYSFEASSYAAGGVCSSAALGAKCVIAAKAPTCIVAKLNTPYSSATRFMLTPAAHHGARGERGLSVCGLRCAVCAMPSAQCPVPLPGTQVSRSMSLHALRPYTITAVLNAPPLRTVDRTAEHGVAASGAQCRTDALEGDGASEGASCLVHRASVFMLVTTTTTLAGPSLDAVLRLQGCLLELILFRPPLPEK